MPYNLLEIVSEDFYDEEIYEMQQTRDSEVDEFIKSQYEQFEKIKSVPKLPSLYKKNILPKCKEN